MSKSDPILGLLQEEVLIYRVDPKMPTEGLLGALTGKDPKTAAVFRPSECGFGLFSHFFRHNENIQLLQFIILQ